MVNVYYGEHHKVTRRVETKVTAKFYKIILHNLQQRADEIADNVDDTFGYDPLQTDIASLPKKHTDVTNEQWLTIIKDITDIDKYMLGELVDDWVTDRKGGTEYSWVISDDDGKELLSEYS